MSKRMEWKSELEQVKAERTAVQKLIERIHETWSDCPPSVRQLCKAAEAAAPKVPAPAQLDPRLGQALVAVSTMHSTLEDIYHTCKDFADDPPSLSPATSLEIVRKVQGMAELELASFLPDSPQVVRDGRESTMRVLRQWKAELERLTEIADEYSDHKLMCGQELRRELEQVKAERDRLAIALRNYIGIQAADGATTDDADTLDGY